MKEDFMHVTGQLSALTWALSIVALQIELISNLDENYAWDLSQSCDESAFVTNPSSVWSETFIRFVQWGVEESISV